MRLPKEDGAWYMALACGACGWLAAWKLAWEPLLVAVGLVGLLAAAQRLRRARRLGIEDPGAVRGERAAAAYWIFLPMAAGALLFQRIADPLWIFALGAPAVLYAPFLLSGAERNPGARILAVVAITGVAPAMYIAATGIPDRAAILLWAVLGGYFVLASLLVMARIRRGRFATGSVALVRLASFAAVALVVLAAEGRLVFWILGVPFFLLLMRSSLPGAGPAPPDPRKIGRAEAGYSVVTAVLVLIGVWMI